MITQKYTKVRGCTNCAFDRLSQILLAMVCYAKIMLVTRARSVNIGALLWISVGGRDRPEK
jgi:hypothetical protein